MKWKYFPQSIHAQFILAKDGVKLLERRGYLKFQLNYLIASFQKLLAIESSL
jgi:hypothetical protein